MQVAFDFFITLSLQLFAIWGFWRIAAILVGTSLRHVFDDIYFAIYQKKRTRGHVWN